MNLPIVVAAYNRPESLSRLLTCLCQAEYPEDKAIELIISIDHSDSDASLRVAQNLNWMKGEKTIIYHENNLGLKAHIISCGDLALQHDGVILLEDDLVVSPSFYHYAIEASEFYAGKNNIAGISLYGYERNEYCDLPFQPVIDGFDTYVMKVPSSWGQIFLRNSWMEFKNALVSGIEVTEFDFLPESVHRWPETSWKKLYFKYMNDRDLYFVYPVNSYSSNMGEIGIHYPSEVNFLKTNISLKKENFRFPDFHQTINIYDQFMEWEPLKVGVESELIASWREIEIDLYGYKPLDKITSSKIVTSRNVKTFEQKIPIILHPVQLNLLHCDSCSLTSEYNFYVTEKDQVKDGTSSIREYFSSCLCPSLKKISFQEGINAMKHSKKYLLGNLLLKPLEIMMNFFKK